MSNCRRGLATDSGDRGLDDSLEATVPWLNLASMRLGVASTEGPQRAQWPLSQYFKARMLPARGRLYTRYGFTACLLFIVGAFIHGALVARSLPAADSLRVYPLFTVGLSFERSTVISMCVADPRLTVRPMRVQAQCRKGQHRAQSWFTNCPVVVRSLPVKSSPPVYSQYTACSPRIHPDLFFFFRNLRDFRPRASPGPTRSQTIDWPVLYTQIPPEFVASSYYSRHKVIRHRRRLDWNMGGGGGQAAQVAQRQMSMCKIELWNTVA